MEKQLVLVHVRPGSGTESLVSIVHVEICIAARAPHYDVIFNPHEAPSIARECYWWYWHGANRPLAVAEGMQWLLSIADCCSKTWRGACAPPPPLPSRSLSAGGHAVSGSWLREAVRAAFLLEQCSHTVFADASGPLQAAIDNTNIRRFAHR